MNLRTILLVFSVVLASEHAGNHGNPAQTGAGGAPSTGAEPVTEGRAPPEGDQSEGGGGRSMAGETDELMKELGVYEDTGGIDGKPQPETTDKNPENGGNLQGNAEIPPEPSTENPQADKKNGSQPEDTPGEPQGVITDGVAPPTPGDVDGNSPSPAEETPLADDDVIPEEIIPDDGAESPPGNGEPRVETEENPIEVGDTAASMRDENTTTDVPNPDTAADIGMAPRAQTGEYMVAPPRGLHGSQGTTAI